MKEKELREHAICSRCKKPIGHTGLPLFWTLRVERFGIKSQAIHRQDGLAAFLGNSALASVMGPDEDLAESILDPVELTLCEECALGSINIAIITLNRIKATAEALIAVMVAFAKTITDAKLDSRKV